MSRAGTPTDNGAMEAINGWIKAEMFADFHVTSNENIYEEIDAYNKMGYKYFKIEGRTLPSDIILMQYLYYWVKPEGWGVIMHEAISEEGVIINSPNTF